MNNVRSWHRFGFLGFGGPGSPIETGALDQMISISLIQIKSLSEGIPLSDVESKYQNLRYECVLRFFICFGKWCSFFTFVLWVSSSCSVGELILFLQKWCCRNSSLEAIPDVPETRKVSTWNHSLLGRKIQQIQDNFTPLSHSRQNKKNVH